MHLRAAEEYGLRCLLRMAADPGPAPLTIAAIAHHEGLSPEYVAKILRRLRLAGLIESTRGAGGGYRLARPAADITVWEALEQLGGRLFPDDFCACHGGVRRECVRLPDCSLRALWRTLGRTLQKTLEATTLAELLRHDEPAMLLWLEEVPRAAQDGRGATLWSQ